MSGLGSFFQVASLTDCELAVPGETGAGVKAHKVVLAGFSAFFYEKFVEESEKKEGGEGGEAAAGGEGAAAAPAAAAPAAAAPAAPAAGGEASAEGGEGGAPPAPSGLALPPLPSVTPGEYRQGLLHVLQFLYERDSGAEAIEAAPGRLLLVTHAVASCLKIPAVLGVTGPVLERRIREEPAVALAVLDCRELLPEGEGVGVVLNTNNAPARQSLGKPGSPVVRKSVQVDGGNQILLEEARLSVARGFGSLLTMDSEVKEQLFGLPADVLVDLIRIGEEGTLGATKEEVFTALTAVLKKRKRREMKNLKIEFTGIVPGGVPVGAAPEQGWQVKGVVLENESGVKSPVMSPIGSPTGRASLLRGSLTGGPIGSPLAGRASWCAAAAGKPQNSQESGACEFSITPVADKISAISSIKGVTLSMPFPATSPVTGEVRLEGGYFPVIWEIPAGLFSCEIGAESIDTILPTRPYGGPQLKVKVHVEAAVKPKEEGEKVEGGETAEGGDKKEEAPPPAGDAAAPPADGEKPAEGAEETKTEPVVEPAPRGGWLAPFDLEILTCEETVHWSELAHDTLKRAARTGVWEHARLEIVEALSKKLTQLESPPPPPPRPIASGRVSRAVPASSSSVPTMSRGNSGTITPYSMVGKVNASVGKREPSIPERTVDSSSEEEQVVNHRHPRHPSGSYHTDGVQTNAQSMAQSHVSNYPIVKCHELSFKSDGDQGGALFHLGTRGGAMLWRNPHASGDVRVISSSVGFGLADTLVGRVPSQLRTENQPESWLGVRLLKGRRMRVGGYWLRNRDSNSHCMLSWDLEGALSPEHDGRDHGGLVGGQEAGFNWVLLDSRRSDMSLKGPLASAFFDARPVGFFDCFRIIQRGLNSSGGNNLVLSNLELYGTLMGAD